MRLLHLCKKLQQNSLNLISENSEIMVICHLRTAVPRPVILIFTGKKASSVKHADLVDVFNKVSKSIRTSIVEVSPDPLSPSTLQL